MNTATLDRTPLPWSPTLGLAMPVMDETHEACVALLADVVQAPDETLLSHWALLIDHTQEHFDREDQWMLDTGFAPDNCHTSQHSVILQVMREGGKRGLMGELDLVRQMAYELGLWLVNHIQSMDAALALHLRSAGFDPETGLVSNPQAFAGQEIHSCGSGGGCDSSASETALAAG
ncbi:MAG: hemerythrin [Rhodoferax sp.]|nr:hemerythrin [Rhodoferax sp.]